MGDLETEIETGREEGADENDSPKNSEPKGKDSQIWLVKRPVLKNEITFVNGVFHCAWCVYFCQFFASFKCFYFNVLILVCNLLM